mmetsp:Transcript_68387/g.101575  ORF Transcript_68387/g.101575 Transcript_68387/m.101575 type:complete len:230 (+) Transcript_68387:267-956(+)
MQLSLDASVTVMPEFPFISSLNLSLYKLPSCNIRIVPLSENSGLRGVDLGSLPVLSTWIQDAIETSLEAYISPKYISLDIPYWLYGTENESVQTEQVQFDSSSLMNDKIMKDNLRTELPHMFSAAGEAAIAKPKDPIAGNYQSSINTKTAFVDSIPSLITKSEKNLHIRTERHESKQTEHIVHRYRMPLRLKDMTKKISGPLKVIAPMAVAFGAASLQRAFSTGERNEL